MEILWLEPLVFLRREGACAPLRPSFTFTSLALLDLRWAIGPAQLSSMANAFFIGTVYAEALGAFSTLVGPPNRCTEASVYRDSPCNTSTPLLSSLRARFCDCQQSIFSDTDRCFED